MTALCDTTPLFLSENWPQVKGLKPGPEVKLPERRIHYSFDDLAAEFDLQKRFRFGIMLKFRPRRTEIRGSRKPPAHPAA
jgi:hypothetical protein